MSYLWDLSHLKPRTDVVVPGETITEVFWNAARMRGDKVFLREKELGIWREWTWNQTAEAVREIGNGLLAIGFQPGDCASILANTVADWVMIAAPRSPAPSLRPPCWSGQSSAPSA